MQSISLNAPSGHAIPADCLDLVDVSQMAYGLNRPLHVAAQEGNLEDIQVLNEVGAELHAKGEMGLTPLHYAAMDGNVEIIRLLLRLGANKEMKDFDGLRPIDWARSLSKSEAITALE